MFKFCGDTTHDLLALFESAKNVGTQNDEITVSSDRRNTKIELCGAREVFAESYIRAMYIILFGLKQFHRRTTVEVTTKQRHMLLNVTLQQQIVNRVSHNFSRSFFSRKVLILNFESNRAKGHEKMNSWH